MIGAGAAGLSLAMRLVQHPGLAGRSILIVDRSAKTTDDRTWCYWETGQGFFEDIVFARWNKLWVRHPKGEVALDMGPYTYKMIRGLDLYNYCKTKLNAWSNVHFRIGEVGSVDTALGSVTVDGAVFTADLIFSSVLLSAPVLGKKDRYLLQHFRGWWIETDSDFFQPGTADLMNFRVSQQHGCTFVYVMPVGTRKALVEYTLFTSDALKDEEYDAGLLAFMDHELKPGPYKVISVENGIIPMTNYRFPTSEGKVIYIGTAGGLTKPSTGYTFQNIQVHSQALVDALVKDEPQNLGYDPGSRFRFYDNVLLRVLDEKRIGGADVFFRMFRENPAHKVFRFLDNATNFAEELMIMHHSPKGIFIPAALREWFT